MIEIKKVREPQELIAHRKKPFTTYANMSKEVHEAVLNSLVEEQGYICAYCMRRIVPQKEQEENKKNRKHLVTIEHIDPQSKTDAVKALDYRNMLAVCDGNRGCGSKKNMICDARRENDALYVNPLKPETLKSIRYKSDGTIFSDIEVVNKDLNERLNLNCQALGLPDMRLAALREMQKQIEKKHPTGSIKTICSRYLEYYQQQTRKTPYVGILISWLEKKIATQ